jgi:rubrerythrin
VLILDTVHTAKLTSAEIAALWTQYINETASICFHKHMMEHIVDNDILDLFEYAMSLSTKHLEKIKEFFISEDFPIPIGFTDNDYIPNSPRLFSDVLCLHYLNIMSLHGCHGYSGAVTTSSRLDVRNYFTECLASAVELCNRTKNVLQEKGQYSRPPVINPPARSEYVEDNNFLSGWLGEKRALSCIEITDIYFNLKKSILAKVFVVVANQVAKSDKVKKLLQKALNTKEDHVKMFSELLTNENLPEPPILESEVTNSTITPFSEKLMIYQIGFLFTTAMVY